MGVAEDLGDALAKDTIEAAEKLGDQELIREVARELAATSSTSEESFMTSVRVRLAERRARKYLESRLKNAEWITVLQQ